MVYKLRVDDDHLQNYIKQCDMLNYYRQELKSNIENEVGELKFDIDDPLFFKSFEKFSEISTQIIENKKDYYGDVILTTNEIQSKALDLLQLSVELSFKYKELLRTLSDQFEAEDNQTPVTRGLLEAKRRLE